MGKDNLLTSLVSKKQFVEPESRRASIGEGKRDDVTRAERDCIDEEETALSRTSGIAPWEPIQPLSSAMD